MIFNFNVANQFLKYAALLSSKGYVHNTLGNMAIRCNDGFSNNLVVYTKHKGISLEEMSIENLVVTDINNGNLLYGSTPPSMGHLLNIEVMKCRADINAIIHLHINEIITFFSVTGFKNLPYISSDTPLILGADVYVLNANVNVESEVGLISNFIHHTNCFIMPNHGITTLGVNISQAYHRLNSVVAEVRRIIGALEISNLLGKPVAYLTDEEIKGLYEVADKVIYS